jgi:hypothetical protein
MHGRPCYRCIALFSLGESCIVSSEWRATALPRDHGEKRSVEALFAKTGVP